MAEKPRVNGTGRAPVIKLGPQSQMSEGVHATMANLQEGDTILSADKRLGNTNSSKTDSSKTYFAPPGDEQFAWDFIEKAEDDQQYLGKSPGRPRLLRTAPSQDQQLDPNYVRPALRKHLDSARERGSATPIRDAINAVKATAPRTSTSQKVVGVEWAPRPRPGQHVESTLPHINWTQFGGENYRVWGSDGGYSTNKTYVHPDLARSNARAQAAKNAERNAPLDLGPPQVAPSMRHIPGQLTIEDAGVSIPKDETEFPFG